MPEAIGEWYEMAYKQQKLDLKKTCKKCNRRCFDSLDVCLHHCPNWILIEGNTIARSEYVSRPFSMQSHKCYINTSTNTRCAYFGCYVSAIKSCNYCLEHHNIMSLDNESVLCLLLAVSKRPVLASVLSRQFRSDPFRFLPCSILVHIGSFLDFSYDDWWVMKLFPRININMTQFHTKFYPYARHVSIHGPCTMKYSYHNMQLVRILDLTCCRISDDDLMKLVYSLPKLQCLFLPKVKNDTVFKILHMNLISIDFGEHNPVFDVPQDFPSELPASITNLNLVSVYVSNRFIQAIARSSVKKLALSCITNIEVNALFAYGLQLETLRLKRCFFVDNDIIQMLPQSLCQLSVNHSAITDIDITMLNKSLPNLVRMDLFGVNVLSKQTLENKT